jgi:hypothetical protein
MGSLVDPVEPRIRELLQAEPRMPARVIAERVGWTHSIRLLSGRVAELRPLYLSPDRTTYVAGEIAQHDFVVPAHRAAGRVRTDPHRQAAAGADDDHRVCPACRRAVDPRRGRRRTCSLAGGS